MQEQARSASEGSYEMTDAERIAVLEIEMRETRADVAEIKIICNDLRKIANQGGGAFHAILMLGGLIGWLLAIGAAIFSLMKH